MSVVRLIEFAEQDGCLYVKLPEDVKLWGWDGGTKVQVTASEFGRKVSLVEHGQREFCAFCKTTRDLHDVAARYTICGRCLALCRRNSPRVLQENR